MKLHSKLQHDFSSKRFTTRKKLTVEVRNTLDTSEFTVERYSADIKNVNVLKFKPIRDYIGGISIKLFHASMSKLMF